jgi:protein SCO1/2
MSPVERPSNRPLHWALWTILVLVMLGLCGALALRSFHASERIGQSSAALPEIAPVGAFTMTDANGQVVTDQDLKGKLWVAQFFFTDCPGPCPAVSRQLFALQGMISQTRDVALVSISIDPEHDTPAALRDYARAVGADSKRWLFLAGTPEMTQQLVARDFMIGFKENPQDQQKTLGRFVHSTKLALVDAKGTIRAYYDGLDIETPQKIATDLGTLLREEGLK